MNTDKVVQGLFKEHYRLKTQEVLDIKIFHYACLIQCMIPSEIRIFHYKLEVD